MKKIYNFETKELIEETTDEGNFYKLVGIASTPDIDFVDDIVTPAAMANSLMKYEKKPAFLHQHDYRAHPLGVIDKIYLEGDKTIIEARMPKGIKACDDAAKLIKIGAYGGFSIGFNPIEQEYKDGINTITEIHLLEVSLVSIPCNPKAELISIKSLQDIEKLSDIEDILKSKGFSNKEAETIVSKVKKISKLGDLDLNNNQGDLDEVQLAEISKSLNNLITENKLK